MTTNGGHLMSVVNALHMWWFMTGLLWTMFVARLARNVDIPFHIPHTHRLQARPAYLLSRIIENHHQMSNRMQLLSCLLIRA